jgi:hypothetical protein
MSENPKSDKTLNWTAAPPTKPGLYWFKWICVNGQERIFICDIMEDTRFGAPSVLHIDIKDEFTLRHLAKDAEWYGPISPPELPKE